MNKLFYLAITLLWGISGPAQNPVHRVFLIGDAGACDTLRNCPALLQLQKQLAMADPDHSSVIFLGDNVYPHGMPGKKDPGRRAAENRLNVQLQAVRDFGGAVVFIPGNHDWARGKPDGEKFRALQEDYLSTVAPDNVVFLPERGCPGPVELDLDDQLTAIIGDTQWWLHRHRKKAGGKDGCQVLNKAEWIAMLKEYVKSNRNKHVLVLGHHPMFSKGIHGGYFPLEAHLFPLRSVRSGWWIPLPVLGSIYPFYRSVIGHRQDLAHPDYQQWIQSAHGVLKTYAPLVYAAGHEHNLQYSERDGVHHIVSGSGSKSTPVGRIRDGFSAEDQGFSVLRYQADGSAWVDFIRGTDGDTLHSRKLYQKELRKKGDETCSRTTDLPEEATAQANAGYAAGKVKRSLLGAQYRDWWTQPVRVPVFDITREHGGLRPVKKGGGQQTMSLRLQAKDGRQYALRTIKKFSAALVPSALKNTLAQDLIADGISASNPYGAMVVRELSDRLGIYHTSPRLVYVPDDPCLGDFRDDFAGLLCWYEERPNDTWIKEKEPESEMESTFDVMAKVLQKSHHRVHQPSLLRARLFDILIADWDRHDDQWRWIQRDEGATDYYYPVPRDRDQAFFMQDGLIPNIVNRKWAVRKFQSFHPDIRDMAGQNFNARFLDRSFLNELEKTHWDTIVQDIGILLPDSTITSSFKVLPEVIGGDEKTGQLIQTLRERRDKLPEFAARYYRILAREVDIVGTNDEELFDVDYLANGHIRVTVYSLKNNEIDGEPFYQREFDPQHTREISIYGVEDNDRYHVRQRHKSPIRVRIFGGEDKDHYHFEPVSLSRVEVYEGKGDNDWEQGRPRRVHRKKDGWTYDRESFRYDQLMPLPWFGFNENDGVYLGAGFDYRDYHYPFIPYRKRTRLRAQFASRTGAYAFDLQQAWPGAFGRKWGLQWDVEARAPENQFFFYGLGNQTNLLARKQARVQLNQYRSALLLTRYFNDHHWFFAGPGIEVQRFRDQDDLNPESLALQRQFPEGEWGTFQLGHRYFLESGLPFTGRSVRWDGMVKAGKGMEFAYFRAQGEWALTIPLGFREKSALALRGGGTHIWGDFPVQQAAFVGGQQEIRGYLRNRFAGKSALYSNVEFRLRIWDQFNYLLPFSVGLSAFSDQGRVWLPDENSQRWHHGYGGGLHIVPAEMVTLSAYMGFSQEGRYLNVRMGLFF